MNEKKKNSKPLLIVGALAVLILPLMAAQGIKTVNNPEGTTGTAKTDPKTNPANTAKDGKAAPTQTVDWLQEKGSSELLQTHPDLLKKFAYVMLCVVVLGAVAIYLSKKYGTCISRPRGRHISVLETVSLAPNRMLHVVEIEGRRLLISSTPQTINLITDILTDPEPEQASSAQG